MKRLSLSLSLLVILLAAAASFYAQAQATATAPSTQMSMQHVVPTNLPGVYAFTRPPEGFDPLTASPEELESWGYPPRPRGTEGARALAHWLEETNPALRREVPHLVRTPGVYHRAVKGLVIKSSTKSNAVLATSGNWSGFALVPASGAQPFYHVTAHWTVPTVRQAPGTCSGGWDYSSQWVGIGGFNDSFLLQAGSAANVFCDIGNNIAEYFPWLEWLPQSELVLYKNAATATLFPFAPGDYVIVTVFATNFASGVSTTGNLSFADVTQGWNVALTFSAASVGGSEVTGQSAEWIVDRGTDRSRRFARDTAGLRGESVVGHVRARSGCGFLRPRWPPHRHGIQHHHAG